jgi:nitrate reductase gamma subunit
MDLARTWILLAVLLLPAAGAAEASWRLDPERFHWGAHGRLSCRECHEAAAARRPHPDPAAVNRRAADFFSADVCAACHADALEELASGRHGAGAPVPAGSPEGSCIACHDPHYGLSASAPAEALAGDPPAGVKCALCHAPEAALPPAAPQDEACLGCHLRPAPEDPAKADKTQAFCLACHDAAAGGPPGYPRLARAEYAATAHGGISCTACHRDSDRYGHGRQAAADCRGCHFPHPAAVANEVHLNVACGACHVDGAVPVRERAAGRVVFTRERTADPSRVHRMRRPEPGTSCRACHFAANGLGAPAAVLPAKGVLCMPCHAATFSASDAVTLPALVVFGLGAAAVLSVGFSGGRRRTAPVHPAARTRWGPVLSAFLADGLLQRRLFRYSRLRWAAHALVFFPFVFRFAWGLAALAGSRLWPQADWVWAMLDPNHPLTAFLFDLSGLAVLVGASAMIYRRLAGGRSDRPKGLPPADWPAYALLGAVMLAGFLLEGARIALGGYPPGSAYAFVGDAVSRAFYGTAGLEDLYGPLWYAHAILTGLFAAYLPFSQMRHLLVAPIILALRPLSTSNPDHP